MTPGFLYYVWTHPYDGRLVSGYAHATFHFETSFIEGYGREFVWKRGTIEDVWAFMRAHP